MRDVYCFFATIYNVITSDGIVEGDARTAGVRSLSGFEDADTLPGRSKKILITGADSYIGEAFRNYLMAGSRYYTVDVLDAVGFEPEPDIFKPYDVVFNVAGIVHAKEKEENRHLYYEINTGLVTKIAMAAKKAGVRQFVLLSSMSVYGKITGRIDKATIPRPTTDYGKSKLIADELIGQLTDEHFKVAVLRAPMVYGKGCRGNYQILRTIALKSPLFPQVNNQRSMIYIGNLCEFIKRVIDRESSGVFFPQNRDYVRTSEMVRQIAAVNGRKIKTTHIFNPLIRLFGGDIGKKAFGNLTYERTEPVSKYSFDESINITESRLQKSE